MHDDDYYGSAFILSSHSHPFIQQKSACEFSLASILKYVAHNGTT